MTTETEQLIQQTTSLIETVQGHTDAAVACRKKSEAISAAAAANWGLMMAGGQSPSGFHMGVRDKSVTVIANRLVLSDVSGLCVAISGINRTWTAGTGLIEPNLLTSGAGWRYVWLISDGSTDLQLYVSSSASSPVGVPAKYKYWRYCGAIYSLDAAFNLRYATKDGTGTVNWLDQNQVFAQAIGANTWQEFNHAGWVPPHVYNVVWDISYGTAHGCFRVSWVRGGADNIALMGAMHSDDLIAFQISLPLAPTHKSLWMFPACGNQTVYLQIRGYKEQPI